MKVQAFRLFGKKRLTLFPFSDTRTPLQFPQHTSSEPKASKCHLPTGRSADTCLPLAFGFIICGVVLMDVQGGVYLDAWSSSHACRTPAFRCSVILDDG